MHVWDTHEEVFGLTLFMFFKIKWNFAEWKFWFTFFIKKKAKHKIIEIWKKYSLIIPKHMF